MTFAPTVFFPQQFLDFWRVMGAILIIMLLGVLVIYTFHTLFELQENIRSLRYFEHVREGIEKELEHLKQLVQVGRNAPRL